MYAQLGNTVFENLKGFNDFSKTYSVTYAEHKPLVGKPLLQATGPTLDEVSLSIRLHASFCKPLEELNALREYMDYFEVLPLLWGNGKKEGDFVITNISNVIEEADPKGNVISYIVSCTLKEYVLHDRLKAEQDANRRQALAVGGLKPVAKLKTNPLTPPQDIAKSVSAIKIRTNAINETVEQKGGPANSVKNRNAILRNAEAIKKSCTDIRNKYEQIKGTISDNEVLKEIKQTAEEVSDAAEQVRNTLSIPEDFMTYTKSLTQSVKNLKTAARPIVLKSSYRPAVTTKVTQHTTKDGERWDTVALRYYGSASMMNRIIEANPGVPRSDALPAGVVLNIPIIEKFEVVTDAERLPPWRR
jgi:phage protein U/phage tail protein X/gas vesicle protein